VVLVCLLPLAGALAEDPPRLDSPVTDTTGLTNSVTIGNAVDRLRSDGNIQLYEVYVGTTAPLDMNTFVEQTVRRNNLSGRYGLFVVAVGDMTYELWLGPEAAEIVSESEQNQILDDAEARLSAGDYTGAGVSIANGVRSAASSSSGFSGSILTVLIPIGLIVAAIAGVWWFRSRRRKQRARVAAAADS
jgi:hypothetical protein